jgi:hypothetical protein
MDSAINILLQSQSHDGQVVKQLVGAYELRAVFVLRCASFVAQHFNEDYARVGWRVILFAYRCACFLQCQFV